VAELLGQAGVGTIQLSDLDRLKTGNVARHVGGVRDFGACKTRVVAARLFDVNPFVEIPPVIDGSAVASLDGLAEYLRTADLTVCTVADEQVESAINQIAVLEGKAVLYARALRRGAIGRVFLVRPGRDPCKACLGEYARLVRRGEPVTRDWIEVAESGEDPVVHECGRPVIPASAIDLSFIASLAARAALYVLEEADGETNHWLWSRDSAVDVDLRLDHPLATMGCCLPPWAACGICGEQNVSRLRIQDDVRSFIVKQVESSVSTETGGILIGFVDDSGEAVVLRATGPGPNAEKSATRFDRDVMFVQRELDAAASELGEHGQYIGEWHSHLVPDPKPSPLDISSMSGIAASTDYSNSSPVLLLVGLDKKTVKVQNLSAWNFAFGRRMESLDVVVADKADGCA
jgi:integrative and conjugative element protein (TIGR02256 family)